VATILLVHKAQTVFVPKVASAKVEHMEGRL
jgi:hypothetical protein